MLPNGTRTYMTHTSMALMAQYLNVRQRKLGTIIIQTVCILQHDSAVTGSLTEGGGGDFASHEVAHEKIGLPMKK
jgi:hypothetical protein